jgi:hypothetical protein
MTELSIPLEKLYIGHEKIETDINYGLHILLADGSVKNSNDIIVGDLLMSEDGTPNKVIEVEKKRDMLYNITQTRGESYTISGNDILVLKATNMEAVVWDKARNAYKISWLEQFQQKGKRIHLADYNSKEETYEGAKKYLKETVPKLINYTKYKDILEIKVTDFVEIANYNQKSFNGFCIGFDFNNNVELPIDPYTLGQWIGDGNSDSARMTTADKEVVEYFTEYANTLGLKFKEYSKYHYGLTTEVDFGPKGSNPFLTFLQNFNLINNKHIPNIYKFSSRENRLKLLAGLVDSDGSNGGGYYDFTFKSEKIADDTVFLARSLGFRTNKKDCKRTCTNAPNGPKEGDYFRFGICGNDLKNVPVLLERKKILERNTKIDATVVGIKITELQNAEFNSIKLENNKKIILRDHTVLKLNN